jgi:opacity protein-like surface antigen
MCHVGPRLVTAAICLCTAGLAPAEAEWVVGGYLGAGHTMTGALSVVQPAADTNLTFASLDYHGESFTPPVYYGYRITYFPPQLSWFGVEAEFIHLKVYARTDAVTRVSGRFMGTPFDHEVPVADIPESFSLSHGLNFALVNVVARGVLSSSGGADGRVELLGRVGLGPTIPHAESRVDGVFHEGYEIGAPGLHVAGGIEVRLVRGLSAMAEYKLTSTNQTVAISEGHAHGRFTSHHVVFGVGWHL